MIIAGKSTFHECSKYYPKVFLDECLHRLYVCICYNMIGLMCLKELILKIGSTIASRERTIYHHWYFLEMNFRFF